MADSDTAKRPGHAPSDTVPDNRGFLRALTFLGTTLVMLVSGTAYLAGLWTVLYASRVGYTQTEMATVGSVGFLLSALSAIPLGWLGDTLESPAPLLIFGGTAMFLGYFGLGGTYLGIIPHFHVAVSAIYVALASAGNVASIQGALFTNVRNFPERLRGLATGIPISAIGLSAFFFTGIARTFFMVPILETGEKRLDVGRFLVAVGVIGGIANAIGAATVRKVPLDPEDQPAVPMPAQPNRLQRSSSGTSMISTESSPLLDTRNTDGILDDGSGQELRIVANLLSPMTYLWLYAKLALSGAGSMFIGNVGSVILALSTSMPDDPALQKLQSASVATISVGSAIGRVLFGFLYDYSLRAYSGKRITLFAVMAAGFFGCQLWIVGMLRSGDASSLLELTAVLGTFYGGIASKFCPS